jgi:hypothetical protein
MQPQDMPRKQASRITLVRISEDNVGRNQRMQANSKNRRGKTALASA